MLFCTLKGLINKNIQIAFMKYFCNSVVTLDTENKGEDSAETMETGKSQQREVVSLLETVIGMYHDIFKILKGTETNIS